MEILLNELSLTGQFDSIQNFIDRGLKKIIQVFHELESGDNILKKYDFYAYKITSESTIHEVLVGGISRQYDEIRRFKIFLSQLFENPYWEDNPRQSKEIVYRYGDEDISGSSLAEASERDCFVISFHHPDFVRKRLELRKNVDVVNVENICGEGDWTEALWNQERISFEKYCHKKYNKRSKLSFSDIDINNGFNLLLSKSDILLFKHGFEKFIGLDWPKIQADGGFDFKKFQNKRYFRDIPHQIFKFRISEKYRCFGYVYEDVYYVIRFDLDHELSDKG